MGAAREVLDHPLTHDSLGVERVPAFCIEATSHSTSRQELDAKMRAFPAAGAVEAWHVSSETKRMASHGAEGIRTHSRFGVDPGGRLD